MKDFKEHLEASMGRWTIGLILCVSVLCVLEWQIAKLFGQNDLEASIPYMIIMGILTVIAVGIIAAIKTAKVTKDFIKYEQEQQEQAKKKLDSGLKTVLLNRPDLLPKEKFECQAEANDVKIVCKVHADFVLEFDNYGDFLKFFEFPDE